MKIEKSYGFRIPGEKFNIVLIGAGGTGGFVLSQLARLKGLGVDNEQLAPFDLTIVDGDEVEAKNCVRQMFFTGDVGDNKAEVLAERYGGAFETEISSVSSYIETEEALSEAASGDGIPVIVGCVDNHKTRQLIDGWFVSNRCLWIDSGNEEFSGQVVCGYSDGNGSRIIRSDVPTDEKIAKLKLGMKRGKFELPSVTELCPDVANAADTKFNSELGCAERAEAAPQNTLVNSSAAQIVLLFLRKILTRADLRCCCVTFSIDALNTRTTFNTESNVEAMVRRYEEEMA
jgi:PRTRC genetic system ThiF family protein